MPQDAITISYLAKELEKTLVGSKIVKINQPEGDEIHLQIYTKIGNKKLVISASGNSPRCHFTDSSKSNPQTPPAFCMLLRKHLTNGIIKSVQCVEGDRILILEVMAKNELDDIVTTKLYVELMSRQSNLILVNHNGKVLGALKHFSLDDKARSILGGLAYELPDNGGRTSPYDLEGVKAILNTYTDGNVAKYILSSLSGFSYLTVTEIIYRAFNVCEKFSLEKSEKDMLANSINDFLNMDIDSIAPCVGYINEVPKEYFFTKYTHLDMNTQTFDSISTAISVYYYNKDRKERMAEHAKSLRNVIKNHISRNEKKLSAQLQQLKDCEDMEKERIKGELITSNIYQIKKGMDKVSLINYYDEESKEITVTLDVTLSPSQNAQKYYKRYAKMKRTLENVSKQVIDTREHLQMLQAFLGNLSTISSTEEIALIKQDLISSHLIRRPAGKKGRQVKDEKAKPMHYIFDDYNIYVGRNSTENEFVTHKLGRNKDMWLHAKGTFGSHVIIKYEGKELSDEVILFGAELAGYYSTVRDSEKADIDYTEVKNVKKPPSQKLGMVIYNTNYSMLVKPNGWKEYLQKR